MSLKDTKRKILDLAKLLSEEEIVEVIYVLQSEIFLSRLTRDEKKALAERLVTEVKDQDEALESLKKHLAVRHGTIQQNKAT